jgi:FixJ family two-component response regulator
VTVTAVGPIQGLGRRPAIDPPGLWVGGPGGATGTAPASEEVSMSEGPLVSVVDDNESVRESLPDLLRQSGYAVQAFSTAEEFLASDTMADTRCLILDVGLPGMSGPGLQQELKRRAQAIPIVFITAQGDKSLRPRLLAAGAVACLFKPFTDTALLEAVEAALGTR